LFLHGALLFASTALADIVNKDGYTQLKEGLKAAAASCSSSLDSFTMEMSAVLKDNGKIMYSDSETKKYDNVNKAVESNSSHENTYSGSSSSYYYSDPTTDIRYYSDSDDTYHVTEYSESRENPGLFDNPFEDEQAGDIERIADALVGSLRDHVAVRENADGSKELSGSLTEVQIPAIVNAVVSMEMRQQFNGQNYGQSGQMPDLAQDVFVKEVSGSAVINPDGLMESILGTVVISGKDTQGTTHEITAEILVKLKDINTTTVVKPDLSGKTVIKEEGKRPSGQFGLSNPEKFIGEYKNDIIMEKDGKFVKAGERRLVIDHIDSASATGSYREEYKPEFEQYAANKQEFTFSAAFDKEPQEAAFTYTTPSGTTGNGNIYLDDHAAKINFWIDGPSAWPEKYDSIFNPILE
jgi:hypothetical protein